MAVYGVVAFGVLQIADIAFPLLSLPEWTVTFVLALSLLGFPIAVVLAWAFEMTPGGVRRTEEAAPGELSQIVQAPASRRWPPGVLALVGTAALVWGAWYVGRQSSVNDAAEVELRRSVAVLPFADLTNDDYSRAFALGLHDDLLTQLSRIEDLRVTSRTSVMAYAETDLSAGEIARELGVGTLVEGGVRTSGDRIRLNVQLIDPQSDEHLWAETYDREITAENVFAIQAEIARAVAERLEAELTPETEAALADLPTENIEAWNAYNRARLHWDLIGSEASERQVVTEAEAATQMDPEFLSAWGYLVMGRAWLIRQGLEVDTLPAYEALERLRELAPDSPERYKAEGYYHYYAQANFPAALTSFQTTLALRPADRDATEWSAYVLRRLGRWVEVIDMLDSLIRVDPRNVRLLWNQGVNFSMTGEFEQAEQLFEMALILQPTSQPVRSFYVNMLQMGQGDIAGAREVNERPPGFVDESYAAVNRFWSFYFLRDYSGAIAAIRDIDGRALQIPETLGPPNLKQRNLLIALALTMAGDESGAKVKADSAVEIALAELNRRPSTGLVDRFGFRTAARSSLALGLALRGREGDHGEAVLQATEAVRQYGRSVDAINGLSSEWTLAQVYAITGRHDEALRQLAGLLENPTAFAIGNLRLDPIWDPIRDDPRFQAIIEQRENFSIR